MPTRRALAATVFLAVTSWTTGCTTLGDDGLPPLADVPWQGADQPIRSARRAWYQGDAMGALAQVEAILAADPRHVDAHRIRQDVLRQRGRLGLLVHESETRLAAAPDDPLALYLAGRLTDDDEARRALFGRAVEVAPESFWSWLGYAFSVRSVDAERSRMLYEQLYARSDGHPLAAVALAAAYRGAGDLERARKVYSALRVSTVLDPVDRPNGAADGNILRGIGELGIAETYMIEGEPAKAWAPLLEALKLRPHDPGLLVILRDFDARGLGSEQRDQLLDVLRGNPVSAAGFVRAGGQRVYADLLLRAGHFQGALEVIEREGEPRDPATRRLWRRLLLTEGSVGAFLRVLREDVPGELLADETNQVRGLWLTLLGDRRAASAASRSPWAELDGADDALWAERGPAFADALLAVGLLYEAEVVAQRALRARSGPSGAVGHRDQLDEIQRELAFEGALRRIVYRAYKEGSTGGDIDLDAVLEDVRKVSQTILGRDVVGEPERFSVPLLGEMLDPFGPGLPQHLARYNRHLTLGQRSGSVPEGLLLTRVIVRDLPAHPDLPVPTRCTEVVGENRSIRSLSGVYGGDLAGLALLNHYVIDLDAARDWGLALRRKQQVAEADGWALLDDPIPEGGTALAPWGADWRLAACAAQEDPEISADLTLPVLDMIRWHEHAHVADFFHYLPPETNLLRNVALLATGGFSAHGVESTMERRAEGAALALSPYTRLVMAHIAEFLAGDRQRSAHALGFSDLAVDVIDGVEAAMGGVGAAGAVVDVQPRYWHRLDPELVRQVALELLRERF